MPRVLAARRNWCCRAAASHPQRRRCSLPRAVDRLRWAGGVRQRGVWAATARSGTQNSFARHASCWSLLFTRAPCTLLASLRTHCCCTSWASRARKPAAGTAMSRFGDAGGEGALQRLPLPTRVPHHHPERWCVPAPPAQTTQTARTPITTPQASQRSSAPPERGGEGVLDRTAAGGRGRGTAGAPPACRRSALGAHARFPLLQGHPTTAARSPARPFSSPTCSGGPLTWSWSSCARGTAR